LKVVEHGNTWDLYEEGNSFFLSALCSHGAADYEFNIELNQDEVENYKRSGSAYLDKLAYEIHYSAPGVIGNNSIYKSRTLSIEFSEKFKRAYSEWRNS
jgi:hypothetical protein